MELARQQWRGVAALWLWWEAKEMQNGANELVGQARRRVHVVAGHARASTARGSTLRRPATRGVHVAVEF